MAKKQVKNPPDHLTMNLFDPGMSLLHRAGLGGLACTLRAMERHHDAGLLPQSKMPTQVNDKAYPWEIDDQSVKLFFGTPENAKSFLEKLFEFAFQIKDDVIYLPGQYSDPPPPLSVRAELQRALARSILQGAKKNLKIQKPIPFFVDPDGTASSLVEIELQRCISYKHQQGWSMLIDKKTSTLLEQPKSTNIGSFNPGAIVRHAASGFAVSAIVETPARLVCSYFFLVGCVALCLVRTSDGVLISPEVHSLHDFAIDRPFMTPRTVGEVWCGGVADAAFQTEVRVRARSFLQSSNLPSCMSIRFSLRTWTKPQKSRVNAIELDTSDASRVEPAIASDSDLTLMRFERAMATLPRGLGWKKFDSVVRPLVAENLAMRRKWYTDFKNLVIRLINNNNFYERKGLNAMISDPRMWDHDAEAIVVRAVHAAIGSRFGEIKEIYRDKPELMRKKFGDEREKWGRAFATAMTVDQFRQLLCDFFRRAGYNEELQKNWDKLIPMLRRENWQHARDLALIGLCSYQGRKKEAENQDVKHSNSPLTED